MLAVPLTDYYEEVRRYLTCPEAVKDDLLFDVNRQVMDLNADLPDLDYDDLVEFLGEPEDLARQFMDSLGLDSSPNHQEEKLRPHLVHRIFAIALVQHYLSHSFALLVLSLLSKLSEMILLSLIIT